jgi:hypothetical protein
MDMHDMDYYKTELDHIASMVFQTIKKLGDTLLRAKKDLSAEQYEELEKYALATWTRADLRAAIAVAKGDLDPDLFPAGVRNSKVLSLTELDQKRLLSDEKFDVWGNDGRNRSKPWREMSPDERNRLLGRKGGRIHMLQDQARPGAKGVVRVTVYERADCRDGKLSLEGVNGQRGEIQLGALKATMPADELEVLIDTLRA